MYQSVVIDGEHAQDSVKAQPGFSGLANFAARLREVRKLSGLNQTEFAALGGVTLNSQSRYEKAETRPSVEYIATLASHGIDVNFLLTGERAIGLLDEATSAIVTIVNRLEDAKRAALLAFLRAMHGE